LGFTVRELLERVDSREISEWMAFAKVEPFGEERADIRSAIIACTMANMWLGKNQKPYKITDFMPKFEPDEPQSTADMDKILRQLAGID